MGIGSCSIEDMGDELKDDSGNLKIVGDIWEEFEFQKMLGTGATAYVALVSRKGKFYALKMVSKQKCNQFDRERKILGRLRCPNIVRLEGVYEDKNRYYLAMEYCAGESLLLRMGKRAKYTESVASKTITMVLKAVRYIHDINIVHRDIKPENLVYLSKTDAVLKLLDFGLAMEVQPMETFSYRAGTPVFMAPEVIKNNKVRSAAICKKGDIWSVGICLYILLNGTAPFKGNIREQLFQAILLDQIEFVNKDISSDAKDLVMKLLQKDPKKRINVSEALSHPWIMRGGQKDKERMQLTAKALKRLHTKRCVHLALEEVAMNCLDEFDDKAMKQIFDRWDKDGDGNITEKELAYALEESRFCSRNSLEIAHEIVLKTDRNNDRMIQFDEFKRSMLRNELTQDESRMNVIFYALDLDNNGHISIDELTQCLPEFDRELVEHIKQSFSDADQDKDGQLSFDEFTKLLTINHNLKNSTIGAFKSEGDLYKVVNDNEQFTLFERLSNFFEKVHFPSSLKFET